VGLPEKNAASSLVLDIFTGRMLLSPNRQCQSVRQRRRIRVAFGNENKWVLATVRAPVPKWKPIRPSRSAFTTSGQETDRTHCAAGYGGGACIMRRHARGGGLQFSSGSNWRSRPGGRKGRPL